MARPPKTADVSRQLRRPGDQTASLRDLPQQHRFRRVAWVEVKEDARTFWMLWQGAILTAVRIILTAIEESLAEAWKRFCGDLDFVQVHSGSVPAVQCDAAVSPANSFGFMDGGIDALYMKRFDGIEQRVQTLIRERHHGELLVGCADIVETEDGRIPYVIVALPGLGTGVGQLNPNTCAHQVRQAIDEVLLGNLTPPRTWAEASDRHQSLYTDRPRRLQ